MTGVEDVTNTQFQKKVIESSLPVVAIFYMDWCPHYRRMAPVFEKLALEFESRIQFVRINTEAEPKLASRFHIRVLPTVTVFMEGREEYSYRGFSMPQVVEEHLKCVLRKIEGQTMACEV